MSTKNRFVSLRTLSSIRTNPNPNPCSIASPRSISSDSNPQPFDPKTPNPNPRTRTPLETQFETWIEKLRPGFTPEDVDDAMRSQTDPDLALDIFRWTAQQRNYRHNHVTYHTIIRIAVSEKRFGPAEALIEEVFAGACNCNVALYNSIIRYCCSRRPLFNRGFDFYKKMLRSEECKPSIQTYTLLLSALLKKFNKLNVCYVYLHAVRSLHKQMKASGVIPDVYALNLILKAYCKCLEMDGAIRVFREMGLYGCEADGYSYSYVVKGFCEKGRVDQGFEYFKEMRGRDFVPTSSAYMILICSLAMELRFGEAVDVMFDMLGNSRVPDLLTHKTVLEGLCREGRGDEAFELLEQLRRRKMAQWATRLTGRCLMVCIF
ncbi:hypothetical protein Scep_023615 [Stephania cephalantha]|uniref:Pentatricopeptide repeat-containing protein n=1 Tax=Stephania cephalantha TaxID=152367 RepID=A0AAP0HXN5_9MAGN